MFWEAQPNDEMKNHRCGRGRGHYSSVCHDNKKVGHIVIFIIKGIQKSYPSALVLKYAKNVYVKVDIYVTQLRFLKVLVHSFLAIVLFKCYVLFDFAYDIQTLYSVVIPII